MLSLSKHSSIGSLQLLVPIYGKAQIDKEKKITEI